MRCAKCHFSASPPLLAARVLHIRRLAQALPVLPSPTAGEPAAQGRQLLEAASRLLEENRGSLGVAQVAAAVSAAGLTAATPDRPADAPQTLGVASRSFELRPDEPPQQEASTPRLSQGAGPSTGGQPDVNTVQV